MKTRSVSTEKKLPPKVLFNGCGIEIADFHRKIAPSTAFLTLMVRDSGSGDKHYSPGDQDPYTGHLLMDALEATVYMAPAGSPARDSLQRNFEHWYETVQKMDHARDWWQDVPGSFGGAGDGFMNLVSNLTSSCGKGVRGVTLLPKACSRLISVRGSSDGSEA